jgi:hypothetical protein
MWSFNHFVTGILLAGALTASGLPQKDAGGLMACGGALYSAEEVRTKYCSDLFLHGMVTDDSSVV